MQTAHHSLSPLTMTHIDKCEWVFSDQDETEEIFEKFDIATDLMDDGLLDESKSYLEMVLNINPDHIDALHHLAVIYDLKRDKERSRSLWKRGVDVGRKAIPGRFRRGSSRINWTYLDNRPFLRCLHGHALSLYHDGNKEEALSVLWEILDYNPEDNMGAREIIMNLLISFGRYEEADTHGRKSVFNWTPDIFYGRALALFMLGSKEEAESTLNLNFSLWPLVAKELAKRDHVRPEGSIPGYISLGGRDEAYEFWLSQGKLWPKEAIRWLRMRLKKAAKNGERKTIHGEVLSEAG